MARTHARHRLRRRLWRLVAHAILPVGPVAVLDAQRDRRAERVPMPDARKYLDGVALDLHPSAASVAALPPPQLLVNRRLREGHTCRNALDDSGETWPVRLTRREKAKHLLCALFRRPQCPDHFHVRLTCIMSQRCPGGIEARCGYTASLQRQSSSPAGSSPRSTRAALAGGRGDPWRRARHAHRRAG